MNLFVCSFCHEPIGYVDVNKLYTPVKPEMFKSLYPDRGVPDPFHPETTWQDFHCPYCRLRPFEKEDEILLRNADGSSRAIKIPPEPVKPKPQETTKLTVISCPKCGKIFAHRSSMIRHRKTCNG